MLTGFGSFFTSRRSSWMAGVAVAALMAGSLGVQAQVTGSSQTTTDAQGQTQESATITANVAKKKKPKVSKEDQIKQTKDTKAEIRKEDKYNPLIA